MPASNLHPNHPENERNQPPAHDEARREKQSPDRNELTVEAWRRRELPPRDYLLEGVMCTTSRWLLNGDTGVGKTLLGLELGFAIASAAENFLIWKCVRPARVMYLDGESASKRRRRSMATSI